MATEGEGLLGRVVASIARATEATPSGRVEKSILSQAAESYARRPVGAEQTIPTGFDPAAASLFEAVIEAAFLVANADGEFDETERQTFETVVAEACANTVQRGSLHALVSDLLEQLEEDGFDQRVKMVSLVVQTDQQRVEVLRIAALMAYVSGGVDDSERRILDQLAERFGLGSSEVDDALSQAVKALEP
ncbi:MAG: tellurite resistance TerB family protein [Deltaproteobacteria bacterium]|nr:tellurite resistance TerB family protein [Deltaproteobacteria bacterium]